MQERGIEREERVRECERKRERAIDGMKKESIDEKNSKRDS